MQYTSAIIHILPNLLRFLLDFRMVNDRGWQISGPDMCSAERRYAVFIFLVTPEQGIQFQVYGFDVFFSFPRSPGPRNSIQFRVGVSFECGYLHCGDITCRVSAINVIFGDGLQVNGLSLGWRTGDNRLGLGFIYLCGGWVSLFFLGGVKSIFRVRTSGAFI